MVIASMLLNRQTSEQASAGKKEEREWMISRQATVSFLCVLSGMLYVPLRIYCWCISLLIAWRRDETRWSVRFLPALELCFNFAFSYKWGWDCWIALVSLLWLSTLPLTYSKSFVCQLLSCLQLKQCFIHLITCRHFPCGKTHSQWEGEHNQLYKSS